MASKGSVKFFSGERILQIIDDAAPPSVHVAACRGCMGKHWYFGQASRRGGLRFWRMDLDGSEVFDAVWEQLRSRCEALVQTPLRVDQQYANGSTYGLGGDPHEDDQRPGTYTLLYYAMEEWKDGWDGETVFYDERGEIALAVLPRPNRAVLFDSRIRHVGRAPSRNCGALRVTVAYKLEALFWADMTGRMLDYRTRGGSDD